MIERRRSRVRSSKGKPPNVSMHGRVLLSFLTHTHTHTHTCQPQTQNGSLSLLLGSSGSSLLCSQSFYLFLGLLCFDLLQNAGTFAQWFLGAGFHVLRQRTELGHRQHAKHRSLQVQSVQCVFDVYARKYVRNRCVYACVVYVGEYVCVCVWVCVCEVPCMVAL
jgi:hypothetical protein